MFTYDLQRGAQIGRAVLPGPGLFHLVPDHAALVPHATRAHQQLHRHGIEHLVAQHHAFDGIGQFGRPLHHIAKTGQPLLLARPQAARDVDNGVAAQRHALLLQRLQHLLGQRPAAGAKLPHFVGAGLRQRFGHLHCHRMAVERTDFRRRDKIAAIRWQVPQLGTAMRVIAQPRRVQRQMHEAVERQPAAVLRHFSAYHRLQGGIVGSGRRRGGRSGSLHARNLPPKAGFSHR